MYILGRHIDKLWPPQKNWNFSHNNNMVCKNTSANYVKYRFYVGYFIPTRLYVIMNILYGTQTFVWWSIILIFKKMNTGTYLLMLCWYNKKLSLLHIIIYYYCIRLNWLASSTWTTFIFRLSIRNIILLYYSTIY